MLHAKFRGNLSSGSRRFFTIYGPGSHFGHVTQMPRTNFRSPYPSRLHIKVGFGQAISEIFEIVDGGRRRTMGIL